MPGCSKRLSAREYLPPYARAQQLPPNAARQQTKLDYLRVPPGSEMASTSSPVFLSDPTRVAISA